MAPERGDGELSLRDFVQVVRRRKAIVALTTLVIVALALVWSFLQTPVYAARAQILLRLKASESLFDPDSGQRNDPQRAVLTEIQILRSEPVQALVQEKLGFPATVSARAAGQTDVIVLKAESTSPNRAAEIANVYAETFTDYKRKQVVDDLLLAAQELKAQIDELQPQIDASTGAARDELSGRQALFKSKLDELEVDVALRTGGAQVVSTAKVPTEPVRPQPVRSGVLAGALGLLLGIGLAFLVEFLDDTVKTKADLERVAPSLPVLGLIPSVGEWKSKDDARLISLAAPSSPPAEAYRTLRTSIQFLGMDRPVRTVQITSPSAQEGKTTTLANLAVAMARAGRRVVVVCCDLRRPRVHEFFGLDNTVGFTSVLLGELSLPQALQRVPTVERLYVLPSGPLPPNPSELLSSRRTLDVLTSLRSDGGLLLLDSPPILPVTDGLVLAQHVDATLLVTMAGSTSRKDAARAVEMLRQVDAPLVGAILNGVKEEGHYGYGYYRPDVPPRANGNGNGRMAAPRSSRSRRGGPTRPAR